jgi:hypothetical protein
MVKLEQLDDGTHGKTVVSALQTSIPDPLQSMSVTPSLF